MAAAAGRRIDDLLTAYRDGGGVSWDAFGDDARESQAALNRPWFTQKLAPALAGVPELHAVLGRPGARILDVGCGGGWSTIALARAYPDATVVGVDIDAPSIEAARTAADSAGSDRPGRVRADRGRDPAGVRAVRRRLRLRVPARHAATGRGAGGDPIGRPARRRRW